MNSKEEIELTAEVLDELWFDMSFKKDYIKHKYEFYKLRDTYYLLQQENKQLKERIEKIKKYIEENVGWMKEGNLLVQLNIDKLYKLLKGGNNE